MSKPNEPKQPKTEPQKIVGKFIQDGIPEGQKPNFVVKLVELKLDPIFEKNYLGKDIYLSFTLEQNIKLYSNVLEKCGNNPQWEQDNQFSFYRLAEEEFNIQLKLLESGEITQDVHRGMNKIQMSELFTHKDVAQSLTLTNQENKQVAEVSLQFFFPEEEKPKSDDQKPKEESKNQDASQPQVTNPNEQNKPSSNPSNQEEQKPADENQDQKVEENQSIVQTNEQQNQNASGKPAENQNNNNGNLNVKPSNLPPTGTPYSSNLQSTNSQVQRLVAPEELQQKQQEIEDRLNQMQTNIRNPSMTPAKEDLLNRALSEGIKKIWAEKSTNPIRDLGLFLVDYDQGNGAGNSGGGTGSGGAGNGGAGGAAQ